MLNQSLEPITTSTVNFELENEVKQLSKYQFGVVGNGYKLDLGQLKAGKYSWKATTTINGKTHEKG
ncbi:MAG: hypothetical protein R2779_11450 [Crocinitomicaceae bacterium]